MFDNSIIEFRLQMKNFASSVLQKFGADGYRTFKKVDSDIINTQNRLKELSKSVKINVDTSSLQKANSMLGSIVGGNLIAGAVTSGLGMAKSIVSDSVQAAMDYSMRTKSFEVLVGNAGQGRQLAGDLRSLKQSSMVGAGVYQNAQTLLGFGESHLKVLKDLRQIGDVGMGDADKMASLTLVRAQVIAAGKLMGQDLLQFVNAGFNPLQVMSEKWKEFGFTSKKTIGDLKDMMSEGKISSEMVSKAFEVATSKGGKFYNMMEQIGDTAGGKMAKLKGNWAAFQIDLGNALMPIASDLMSAGNGLLHWMNISKTVPETLIEERDEINTLIESVTRLNAGNEVRASLIDVLKSKYSDFFGFLDREKSTNEDILSLRNKINDAYARKISVSENQLIAQEDKEQASKLRDLAIKAAKQASWVKRNPHSNMFDLATDLHYLGVSDRWEIMNLWGGGDRLPEDLLKFQKWAEDEADRLTKHGNKQQAIVDRANKQDYINNLMGEASTLMTSIDARRTLWGGKSAVNAGLLMKEVGKFDALRKGGGGWDKLYGFDYSSIERLVNWKGNAGGSGANASIDATAKRINGGGGSHIVINLNQPIIGKQEYKVNSMKEATEISVRTVEEQIMMVMQGAARATTMR